MVSVAITKTTRLVSVTLGFAIPISTALSSMLLLLNIPLWFFGRKYKDILLLIKNNKYIWVLFILIGLYFAGMFYGEASLKHALDAFGKMAYFLLIPVMIPFFRDEKGRSVALNIFLLSMTITLFLSYLIWFDLIPANHYIKGNPNDAYVFTHHITHNFLMAFTAFLFAIRVRQIADWKLKFIFIVLTVLAVFNVTVIVGGKTGYVVLVVLTIYYFMSWLQWKGLIPTILAIAVFGILTYLSPSSSMRQYFNEFFMDVTKYYTMDRRTSPVEKTSTGQRMSFYKNSMIIIFEHPILGVGTGGYPQAYAKVVRDTKMLATDNPHNEYLMVTSQLGLLGLGIFLCLFCVQWYSASKLDSKYDKIITRGLVLTFLSASMVTSTLVDHTERTFYIWMSALLFGGYVSCSSQEGHHEFISNRNNEK